MRKKNTYIKLILIIVIFFTFMFIVFGLPHMRQKNYSSTIIVSNEAIWNYREGKWENINSNASIQNLNWKKYKVFVNNSELGDYYLWKDDNWYVFDDKKVAVNIDGDLLAYQSNFDLKVYNFSGEEITDRTYVDEMLSEHQLSTNSRFTSSAKVSFDFDHDGIREDFYLISNVFPDDFIPDNIFSLVFMVKNGEIYPIYTDISLNKGFNGCKPYFRSFLDVDNDNISEFILSCSRYSTAGVVDMLYKFENGEFKILISNQ